MSKTNRAQSSKTVEPRVNGETKEEAPKILTVLRVLVSGRHVACSDGARNDLVCDVRQAIHFRKGMTLTGAVQTAPEEPRLWRYTGPLPKRPGKW